jgi:hypothetical protein
MVKSVKLYTFEIKKENKEINVFFGDIIDELNLLHAYRFGYVAKYS